MSSAVPSASLLISAALMSELRTFYRCSCSNILSAVVRAEHGIILASFRRFALIALRAGDGAQLHEIVIFEVSGAKASLLE